MFEKFKLETLLQDLYDDESATWFSNGKTAYSFYENPEKILTLGGFDLCNRFTNSRILQGRISKTENTESDQSFDVNITKKILGVNCQLGFPQR